MFQIESCVRGHHIYQKFINSCIYKEIWNPSSGEELTCSREIENTKDPFGVAVKCRTMIVGHVRCRISAACALFMAKKGIVSCKITGSRHFSADLPQGRLEVPCVFTFTGDLKDVSQYKEAAVSST